MIRLLLYSNDSKLQLLLASALKPEFSVKHEPDRQSLRRAACGDDCDIIVLDIDQCGCVSYADKLTLCQAVAGDRVPTIVMTEDLRRSATTDFMQRGAFDCVGKPPSLIEFRVIGRRAYEHQSLQKELQSARQSAKAPQRCDQLIGSSGRSQVVYDLIHRVSDLSASVLITGESGTGKELVARAIHNLGNRAREPFVAVSCGAIPETLIESELFGHERGAFTGSTGTRAGYMEQAGRGTLFLDEIGELSLNTQVKLLRVLQQREFMRLGGSRLIPLQARVVFATHRDLSQMVEDGSFRRDLFFRVNVTVIQVPPLRDRTEDIPLLARHFLERYSGEYGKHIHGIHPAAMEALVEYDWPGNVRELENVVQGAVILTDSDTIARSDLPEHLRPYASAPAGAPKGDSFEEILRQFKVDLAMRAVSECNGNKTLAARKLQVSRAYLHRLIRLAPPQTQAAAG